MIRESIELVKYGNRKIYCLEYGYVDFAWISSKVSSGHAVRVTCHKTKRDISARTLALVQHALMIRGML